jgi:hypothetical protein
VPFIDLNILLPSHYTLAAEWQMSPLVISAEKKTFIFFMLPFSTSARPQAQ